MRLSKRVIFGLLLLLTACIQVLGLSSIAHARSLVEIMETKEIRFCFAGQFKTIISALPEGCRENCEFSGIVYEEVKLFLKMLPGVQPKYLHLEWDEQFHDNTGKTRIDEVYTPELLECGKCDLYPTNMTKNEWRLKKFDIVPLFSNRMMVIIPKSKKSQFKSNANLAGKTTALTKNSSFHIWLVEQNKKKYLSNPVKIQLMSYYKILEALKTETIDFMLQDSDMAIVNVRDNLKNCQVAFPVGPIEEIGWAFSKKDKELQAIVRKFFDKQKKDVTSPLNRLWKETYGISLTEFVMLIKSTY